MNVDYIGRYKDQKAYSYWMSGFVDTIFVSKCPSNSKLRTVQFVRMRYMHGVATMET